MYGEEMQGEGKIIYRSKGGIAMKEYSWVDHVVESEGGEFDDGNGTIQMITHGFACPHCGTLLPQINSGQFMRCPTCDKLWQRIDSKIVEQADDEF